ncbi:MAG: flagellar hook-length control protein FliK [Thermoleophilia bacterium]|nr:flagellar hook-length control protein FliK [Thermoleophilia bacterium]
MINNSALSTTLNVADIAPKAATVDPPRGDGAFSEALAGAHSVHDRRESREAAAPSRRDWARDDHSADRTTGQDRADEVRNDASVDRPDRSDRSRDDHTDRADRTQRPDSSAKVDDDLPAADPTTDAAAAADDADAANEAGSTDPTDPTAATEPTAAATVAVAAAPVATDLDAIVVPTAGTQEATTDAVDAAIRLAISGTDHADTTDAATQTTQVAVAATGVDDDAATDVDAATLAQGAEDAGDGDVQVGQKRPSTSMPTTASGPSPVQLTAATFTDGDEVPDAPAVTRPTTAATQVEVASGDGADADVQLVQAAAVDADADADPDVDVDAPVVQLKAGKAEQAAKVGETTGPAVQVDDSDAPEAVQAARLNQQQAPTVAAAAQHQAAVQAKVAEKAAAEDAAGDAAPAKLEPLPTQASSVATAARPEQISNGIRVRDGLLTAQQQVRIDHIAEQLATRLRLSQAAGGSQVQLSLKPRELGDVTVHMHVREGVVAASVLVDRSDTLRTLQTHIEELKRSLEQQGLSIQEFSVDVRGEAGAGGANARAAADLNRSAARTSQGSSSSIAGATAVMPGYDGDDAITADDVHDGDVSVLA